jgi:hypothetical protein
MPPAPSRAPLVRWTLHDLRRTVATGLQRLDVRLEVDRSHFEPYQRQPRRHRRRLPAARLGNREARRTRHVGGSRACHCRATDASRQRGEVGAGNLTPSIISSTPSQERLAPRLVPFGAWRAVRARLDGVAGRGGGLTALASWAKPRCASLAHRATSESGLAHKTRSSRPAPPGDTWGGSMTLPTLQPEVIESLRSAGATEEIIAAAVKASGELQTPHPGGRPRKHANAAFRNAGRGAS